MNKEVAVADARFDYERLISLSNGMIGVSREEDRIALIDEETKLVDALADLRGGVPLARLKLKVMIARLRAEGHHDCEDGERNLRLLESALMDLD